MSENFHSIKRASDKSKDLKYSVEEEWKVNAKCSRDSCELNVCQESREEDCVLWVMPLKHFLTWWMEEKCSFIRCSYEEGEWIVTPNN
jgi:hypothetical protein